MNKSFLDSTPGKPALARAIHGPAIPSRRWSGLSRRPHDAPRVVHARVVASGAARRTGQRFHRMLRRAVLMLGVALFVPAVAAEELTIRIDRGSLSALPIAIVPFATVGDMSGATDIAAIVRADLARSGQFAPMPPEDMPSQPASFSAVNFKDWRLVGMENLVIGKVLGGADGGFVVEFRVIDVLQGRQLMGYRVPTTADNLRLTAHHVADLIYERLLNVKGAFATRIAYVTVEKVAKDKSIYRLQVADADGYDPHTILESAQPLLSPAWSPDGTSLAYVSFEERNSAIYLQDIRSGQRQKVISGSGINSAPAFAPDGQRLAVTLSRDGNPEIYLYGLVSKTLTRLTNHPAIDTEAHWAPDGQSIVFTSDRGGGPQIYRVGSAGGEARRVTYEMGDYNARARFSPDGTKLAVVHGSGRGYQIAVLDLATSSYSVVTDTRQDESPSFAPNGSMIIYATMTGRGTELAATSTDGRLKQRLALQRGEVREPAWGPFRK